MIERLIDAKDSIEFVFILDRSDSMRRFENATISGYNKLIQALKSSKVCDAVVTTVLFNDCYELINNREKIENVGPLSPKIYRANGSSAILDAVGITVSGIINRYDFAPLYLRADKIVFIIATDGIDDASTEYSPYYLKYMIELNHKLSKPCYYLYPIADIDAFREVRCGSKGGEKDPDPKPSEADILAGFQVALKFAGR